MPHHKISDEDVKIFNTQYPKLTVNYNETFHDRFLIVDDKELYLIGASLKDLGKKCFAFTKLDVGDIERIKKRRLARSRVNPLYTYPNASPLHLSLFSTPNYLLLCIVSFVSPPE